jgi:hypothetical protein
VEALESSFQIVIYLFIGVATVFGILILIFMVGIRRQLVQLNRRLTARLGSPALRYQDTGSENGTLSFECYLCEKVVPLSEVVWLPSGSAVCRACSERIDKAG